MKVLVGFATAAGSAGDIARRIAGVLSGYGHEVVALDVDDVRDVGRYDAFVLGSAVHDQAWLPRGSEFLSRHRRALAGRPVWLFSVGLPGAFRGPMRKWATLEEADILAELTGDVSPQGHRLFTGVVTPQGLGRVGAWVFRLLGGRFGDFRDWGAIEAWTKQIAEDLVDIESLA
ncbi:flavodoxin domain-containing protein [Lentzea sp. HUAS12]|uniref:flavodoxin domain-containing protein n=1 Tax=Lentzea sp. HUAS12 TaxID=2951806 RepID=UPI00209FA540|nr:flavodoxin domain-containing protein [Lentzea sp. HUAS12]USX54387.1 flavodoxin domain-containing protein [Lentzea sp. HUAS12]